MSRPRTKAAMKGYEGYEMVDTLTSTRVEIRHSLNRSPTNGCKLAALADIALGNDPSLDLIESPQSIGPCKNSPKEPRLSVSPAKCPMKHSPSLLMSSDSIKAHSIELKTKSFETSFTGTPKSRKRSRQPIGKRTGYKEKKKKSRVEKSAERTTADSSKPKDVYDFEESHDSVEDEIIPLAHARCNKTETTPTVDVKPKTIVDSVRNEEQEDESSYSDRDDYYNFNSVSGSGTEGPESMTIEHSDQDTKSSSFSQDKRVTSKAPKKHLIMGRIFKNVNKKEVAAKELHKKVVKTPIPEQEMDEIFNNLKNKDSVVDKRTSIELKAKSPRGERKTKIAKTPLNEGECDKVKKPSETPRKPHKQHSNAKSEPAPNKESPKRGKESPKRGKESPKRKTQRRCATNRQNKFLETWSSDEYEEFHSTKDILALIEEAEMKEQRTKEKTAKSTEKEATAEHAVETMAIANESNVANAKKKEKTRKSAANERSDTGETKTKSIANKDAAENQQSKQKVKKAANTKFESEDESDFDEHWNKSAKRAKNRKRRQTATTRPEEMPEEKITKTLKTNEKPSKSQNPVKKTEQPEETEVAEASSTKKKSSKSRTSPKTSKSKASARRKRIASDTLYYWSSSSDDEFGRIEPSENDDDASENHLEQHGWIVGDSHKKLVTLLAHAKGKKIEDCGVKETVHKRK